MVLHLSFNAYGLRAKVVFSMIATSTAVLSLLLHKSLSDCGDKRNCLGTPP